MIHPLVYLHGELAQHARGRTLHASLGAQVASTLPASGVVIVFGKEFQADMTKAATWSTWASDPGRLLLIVPPFSTQECALPVSWEARRAEPLAGGDSDLARLLARERQHEIRGPLLPLERVAGQVITGGWRKQPVAGLIVITALPVWSLTTLDHRAASLAWCSELYAQAGEPAAASVPSIPASAKPRALQAEEWTLLLHLCSAEFASQAEALNSLKSSPVHRVAENVARQAYASLSELMMVDAGKLTERGREALRTGPYAAYARALWRQHDRRQA